MSRWRGLWPSEQSLNQSTFAVPRFGAASLKAEPLQVHRFGVGSSLHDQHRAWQQINQKGGTWRTEPDQKSPAGGAPRCHHQIWFQGHQGHFDTSRVVAINQLKARPVSLRDKLLTALLKPFIQRPKFIGRHRFAKSLRLMKKQAERSRQEGNQHQLIQSPLRKFLELKNPIQCSV